jgi:hypothetical protein
MGADRSDPFSRIPSNFFLVTKLFCPAMSASIKRYSPYADHVPLQIAAIRQSIAKALVAYYQKCK